MHLIQNVLRIHFIKQSRNRKNPFALQKQDPDLCVAETPSETMWNKELGRGIIWESYMRNVIYQPAPQFTAWIVQTQPLIYS